MDLAGLWRQAMPYFAMAFLQFGYAGLYLISVFSLKHGMSHYVLVVYRNVVAAIVVAPFALWFDRKTRPKMTLSTFLKILALGLLEPVIDQNLYYMGAKNTSASFSSALYNILPAVTFVNALIFRMEKVNLKERHSQAKIAGTAITVAGALLMILFKGPIVEFPWTENRSHHRHDTSSGSQDEHHWLMGVFMVVFSCFCWSAFFLLQAYTLRKYPAELSLTTLICTVGAAQSSAVALAVERGSKPWLIGLDMRLFAAVYSGVMCSGVAYYMQGIVMKERGPVFVTAFNPVCMIIVTVLGSIILAEEITTGRVIGAIVIVIGLYSLIWGKSKEHILQPSDNNSEKSTTFELPCSTSNTEEPSKNP